MNSLHKWVKLFPDGPFRALSAFSLERKNITSSVCSKEDGIFPIVNLEGQTFPTGKIKGFPLESRNVSLREVETFSSFPAGRKRKTFPSGKGKHFPRANTTGLTTCTYLLVQQSP